MLDERIIFQRLEEMAQSADPSDPLWPENCAGSRKALAIFVGPSPGGREESKRRPIKRSVEKPLWNEPYCDPLQWSNGFRTSFKPMVEQIFRMPYEEAAKLIARFNLDWMQNPESRAVPYRYMWEGALHVLSPLEECQPDLVVPMDEKTFGVLQIALYHAGYEIVPARVGKVSIKIAGKKPRWHRQMSGYKARKGAISMLVIKSPQHPARVYDSEYAKRIGQAIRLCGEQMWRDEEVNIEL